VVLRAKPGKSVLDAARKEAEKDLEATVRAFERSLDQTAKKGVSLVQSALSSAVKQVDKLAEDLRISSGVDRENLRRALEATQGGIDGLKAIGSYAALAPHPAVRAALLGIAAAGGAVNGAGLEGVRREMDKLRDQAERDRIETRRALAAFQREVQRAEAARRRSGRVG
jgi:hypothetical protein